MAREEIGRTVLRRYREEKEARPMAKGDDTE
jgi:hypothetical protein